MGADVGDVEEGLQGELASYAQANHTSELTVRPVALRYPALPTDHQEDANTANYFSVDGTYLANVWEGVYSLESTLATEEARCNDEERVVLAGYSAGALVIHLALAEMEGEAVVAPSRIAAIVLISDPLADGGEAVERKGTAEADAEGLYSKLFGPVAAPASLQGKTIAICNAKDIVCAPGRGASGAAHEAYSSGELEPLGALAADRILPP
jgi:hypothetical protein